MSRELAVRVEPSSEYLTQCMKLVVIFITLCQLRYFKFSQYYLILVTHEVLSFPTNIDERTEIQLLHTTTYVGGVK